MIWSFRICNINNFGKLQSFQVTSQCCSTNYLCIPFASLHNLQSANPKTKSVETTHSFCNENHQHLGDFQITPTSNFISALPMIKLQATICRGIKGFTAAIRRQHASHRAQHEAAMTMQHLPSHQQIVLFGIMPDESHVLLLLLVFFRF